MTTQKLHYLTRSKQEKKDKDHLKLAKIYKYFMEEIVSTLKSTKVNNKKNNLTN